MVAVNQSIGRVIRHRNDYAAIALLDNRYNTSNIKNKLPKWIKDAGVKSCNSFNESITLLSKVLLISKIRYISRSTFFLYHNV